MKHHITLTALIAAVSLTACLTTKPEPEPEIVVEQVEVEPAEVRTCTPKDVLTRLVIPAEYKTGWAITSIDNPPDYVTDPETGEVREIKNPSIESKVPYKKLIKAEQILYVDAENRVITDICEDEGEGDGSVIPDSPEVSG
jgi:hypothetical protein